MAVKSILLLRHAKSAWKDAHLADHDRPLSPRGARNAAALARYLPSLGLRVDLVLCSTALRTRQTLAALMGQWRGPAPPLALEAGLYLASDTALLARLQALPEQVSTVLLVGHNDGIWQLAQGLAGRGDARLREMLAERYPTGCLSMLQCKDRPWAELAWGSAELIALVRPRDLAPPQ